MSEILDEIRNAYSRVGIEVEGVATYGTYYRLRCGRCSAPLGSVGDKLLTGIATRIVDEQFDLYARGLLGRIQQARSSMGFKPGLSGTEQRRRRCRNAGRPGR